MRQLRAAGVGAAEIARQRTQVVNALRGHAAEFGIVAAKGDKGLAELRASAAASGALPGGAAEALLLLGAEIDHLEAKLAAADAKLKAQHNACPMSPLLADISGVGRITALTLSLGVDPAQFRSGRHLAAWLGLAPKERSTGGKQRVGAISRAGDERIRSLLVVGATAVIQHARPGRPAASGGCCLCWNASRASSRRWLWPTRWPASCGP